MELKLKFSPKGLFAIISFVIVTFQSLLSEYIWFGFSYFDEIIAVFCFVVCLTHILNRNVSKDNAKGLVLLFALLIVGLLGNFTSGVEVENTAIWLDVVATFKNFVIFFAFKMMYNSIQLNSRIMRKLTTISKIYIVLCFCLAMLNFITDIGMSGEIDYGMRSFSFIFHGSGNYALPFYAIGFVVVLELAREGLDKKKNRIMLFLLCAAWASSLTARSIAYVVILCSLFLVRNYTDKNGRLKIWQIIAIGIISLTVGFSTILYYFIEHSNTARNVLLRYSFVVMNRFFPIGAGFATYGSNMAGENYSVLYNEFGFTKIWGLSPSNPAFANDSFWPEIIGQFGFVGIILVTLLLIWLYSGMLKLETSKIEKIVLQWICIVFLIGSVGTKTYIHSVTIGFYIVLALYENLIKNSNEIQKIKDEGLK